MKFSNLTIRRKLQLAFGSLSLLVLVVAALSIVAINDANNRFSNFVDGINARALLAEGVRTALGRRAIAARNLVLVGKPEDLAAEKAAVQAAHEDVKGRLEKLKEMAADPSVPDKVRGLIGDIDKAEQHYGPIALEIVRLALENQRDAAIAKMNDQCRPALAALISATDAYLAATADRSHTMIAQAREQYLFRRNALIAGIAVTLLAAAVAGYAIARSITRALGAEPAELGGVARRVAMGNLRPIHGADTAPGDSVIASMGMMQRQLVALIGEVRVAAESIAATSAQIAQDNLDLSGRTEQQASALE